MSLVASLSRVCATSLAAAATLSACSDPASPTPAGAFQATITNASGTNVDCPVDSSPSIGVGTVNESSHLALLDGDDGTRVECRVVPGPDSNMVSGSISRGSDSFSLSLTSIPTTGTAEARISVRGSQTLGAYVPYMDPDTRKEVLCEVSMIAASTGSFWGRFNCPHLERRGSLNSDCGVQDGFFYFETCETE